MDAGTIIFYLIIIVFIISRIRRAMKEGERSSPAKPAKEPGWKKAFKDMMTEIQAGMEVPPEPEGAVSAGRESGWENIAVPAEYTRVQPAGTVAPKPVSLRPENSRARKPSGKMEETRQEIDQQRIVRQRIDRHRIRKSGIITPPEPIPGMPDTGAGVAGSFNPLPQLPDQLQAAVVWSEILAPPLALREIDR